MKTKGLDSELERQSSEHSTAPPTWQLFAAFAAIYIIWGSTYLAIRYAVETIPPFLMAGTRAIAAGALLYAVARLRGAVGPSWKE